MRRETTATRDEALRSKLFSGALRDEMRDSAVDPAAAATAACRLLQWFKRSAPASWREIGPFLSASLLRWSLARYGASPNGRGARLEEAGYYACSLFHRWEAVERVLGVPTSRRVEKAVSVRWGREIMRTWRQSAGYAVLRGAAERGGGKVSLNRQLHGRVRARRPSLRP